MYPTDLKYTSEHEWLRVDEDEGVATVGITQHAQQELGDIVFVELPEEGATYDAHEEMGTVESVKAVAEIFTPVSGEIIEINEAVRDDPSLIAEDPHGEAWLVKIKLANPEELDDLMDAAGYETYLKGLGDG